MLMAKKVLKKSKYGDPISTRKSGDCGKISPERTEKILLALSKGATLEIACNYAGIDYSTLCKWRVKYEHGDERYRDLFNGIKEVEGKAALVWLNYIDNAMKNGQWQAAAWKLERRHSKSYSANGAIIQLAEEVAELKRLHGIKNQEAKDEDKVSNTEK